MIGVGVSCGVYRPMRSWSLTHWRRSLSTLLMTVGGIVVRSIVRWRETQSYVCILQYELVTVHRVCRFMNPLAGR